jgi:hypothetical protein
MPQELRRRVMMPVHAAGLFARCFGGLFCIGSVLPMQAAPAAPLVAPAPDDLSVICDQAAAEASARTGVPVAVLEAISLAETGRKHGGQFRPWPWTVNMEGKGLWFDSVDDARAYVYSQYKRGARSFDVGCFQINYKWHGQAFPSIDAMFDPVAGAVYAAEFLRDLHAEEGSWSEAAGAYHSRTPEFAEEYRARFDRIHDDLAGEPGGGADEPGNGSGTGAAPDIPEIPDIVLVANGGMLPADGPSARRAPRVNRFPLLQAGAAGAIGSLVPLTDGAGRASLFGAAPDPRTAPAPADMPALPETD